MKYLMTIALLSSVMSFSAQAQVSVECYYHFTDETLEITPEMKINSCTADFVWGFDNVCFRGDINELVSLMNSNYFEWNHSYRVYDATVLNEDVVEYTGVDSRNFYSSEFDIARCE